MYREDMLIHGFLEENAKLRPEKVAYIEDETRVTYRQANCMANCFAAWLLQQEVKRGERVAILLENSIHYVASYYGTLKAGCVAVPLNGDLRADSLRQILQQLQPKVLVAGRRSERAIHDLDLHELGVDEVMLLDPVLPWQGKGRRVAAWGEVVNGAQTPDPTLPIEATALSSIIFTSGSTGVPKGVMLSHGNIVSNSLSIIRYLDLRDSDIQMIVLPFFYVMGKSLLNTHLAVGAAVVVNNRFAYPACVVEQMVREGVTSFSGVPSTYAHLLHRSPLQSFRGKLQSLRYCSQAGGHMSRETKARLLETLPAHTKLYIMYGATEAAARLTYVEPTQLLNKIESIGRPIPGVTIRLLDDTGCEVPCGQIGELVAQGPNIMRGYWRDAEGTASVLDENGYHTGDLGYRDQDGYLYLIGRKDSLLKVAGHRISPQEIEDVLISTGKFLEVVVLGVEDELQGQKVIALAVPLNERPEINDILSHCLERLPKHKIPTHIRFVDSLPKNASGKVDRQSCRGMVSSEKSRDSELSPVFAS